MPDLYNYVLFQRKEHCKEREGLCIEIYISFIYTPFGLVTIVTAAQQTKQ